MGRAQAFDQDKALERAMYLFWENGFESTSLKDLLQAMEIQNGSFYHFFGNKKRLFLAALKYYDDDFTQKREALFQTNHPFKVKMRMLFHHVLDRQSAAVCPKGCFLFNSVGSDAVKDLDLYKKVRRSVADFEVFLEDEIKKAIKAGEVDGAIDTKYTASILIAYVQGMMKLSVLDYDDVKFRKQTEYFLDKLGI